MVMKTAVKALIALYRVWSNKERVCSKVQRPCRIPNVHISFSNRALAKYFIRRLSCYYLNLPAQIGLQFSRWTSDVRSNHQSTGQELRELHKDGYHTQQTGAGIKKQRAKVLGPGLERIGEPLWHVNKATQKRDRTDRGAQTQFCSGLWPTLVTFSALF